MDRGPEYAFFKTRRIYDQQVHEKVLNIANHQGNASQSHYEISPHTCWNGYHKKDSWVES